MGSRFYKNPSNMPKAKVFNARIEQLLNMPLPLDDRQRLCPKILRLNEDAKKTWVNFHNEVEQEIAEIGEFCGIKDFAAKAAENAARLAGIFHIFDRENGDLISVETMQKGIGIMVWYLSEIKHVFLNDCLSQENQDAKVLIDWLVKNNFRTYKIADLLRNAPTKLRNKQRRDDAISVLESHYYITVGTSEIIINPKCWSNADA